MKKIICVIMILALCFSFSACGNKTEEENAPGSSHTLNPGGTEASSTELGKPEVQNVWGFIYSVPNCIYQKGLNLGLSYVCDECTVLTFGRPFTDFTSWETLLDDAQKDFFSAVYGCFRIYPTSQEVTKSEFITNQNGIKLYRMEGLLKNTEVETEFVAYYHLINEEHIAFIVGINEDDNMEIVTETVDYIADTLAIDENYTRW